MKRITKYISVSILLWSFGAFGQHQGLQKDTEEATQGSESKYLQNRLPLKAKPYLDLPLGAIKPQGWLKDQLLRMKNGMTGHLDELYPEVVGERNGWLGGDGDGWERGPYWIDGLLPLAYILDDKELKNKVKPWIEWTLNNQQEDGYLGPIPFEKEPPYEHGIQRGQRRDWWPKMVMLKILQQYYNATGDERVVVTLTKYFKYQLQELPKNPLDFTTVWANRRGGDNLQVVYWLYNITGDDFLLELGDIIAEQTFPWTEVFLNDITRKKIGTPWESLRSNLYPFDPEELQHTHVSKLGSLHCVNFAQGLKEPIVFYQKDQDEKHIQATKQALEDIEYFHGQPQGMYGGDEGLHGQDPTKGVEFCSISESMFSLETMLTITGDMQYADLLEKITYNALPTQTNDDFTARQYFQAANQIEISDRLQTAYQTSGHSGTDFVFGLLTGYPCCTTNMHQSWPKYVQNLFYATADGGVAALQYAPASTTLKVGEDITATITETTGFPFRDTVEFTLDLDKNGAFSFHLRIPGWAQGATISINGEAWKGGIANQVAIIDRTWSDGDKVSLKMPMKIKTSQWFDFAHAVERGPLVYALKLKAESKQKNRNDAYGTFHEFTTSDKWNYALHVDDLKNLDEAFKVEELKWDGSYPWNLENTPIQIKARGVDLPEWTLQNGIPTFPAWWGTSNKRKEQAKFEEITLVPYGTTTLRITEFPVFDFH